MDQQSRKPVGTALSDVYDEMRVLARHYFSLQPSDHTLQPTALAHEAFLRLSEHTYVAHLPHRQRLAVAGRAMRHVLVDHARRRKADKRTTPGVRVPLDDVITLYEESSGDLLCIDEALNRLKATDERMAQIVEMRFFGGLSEGDISSVLGCSKRTVRRDWALAQRWLHKELAYRPSKDRT
jgi:RNA polymerase sigma factor (TIGR02999 family)